MEQAEIKLAKTKAILRPISNLWQTIETLA